MLDQAELEELGLQQLGWSGRCARFAVTVQLIGAQFSSHVATSISQRRHGNHLRNRYAAQMSNYNIGWTKLSGLEKHKPRARKMSAHERLTTLGLMQRSVRWKSFSCVDAFFTTRFSYQGYGRLSESPSQTAAQR